MNPLEKMNLWYGLKSGSGCTSSMLWLPIDKGGISSNLSVVSTDSQLFAALGGTLRSVAASVLCLTTVSYYVLFVAH